MSSPLWNREYAWWFAGDTGAAVGTSLRGIAFPMLCLAMTGSPAQAGAISSALALSGAVTMLPGGVLVDSMDRRKVILAYAIVGALVWGVISALAHTEVLGFWTLLVLGTVAGANGGLHGFGSDAALRSIVKGERYVKAQAANQGRDGVVRLAAGPLGGVLFGMARWLPFAVSVVGYLLLAASALAIRTDLRPNLAEGQRPHPLRGWGTIKRWVLGRKELTHALVVLTCQAFALSGLIFLAISTLQIAGFAAAEISLLPLGMGLGAIGGAILAGAIVSRIPTGSAIALTGGVAGVASLLMLLAVDPILFASALAIATFAAPLANASGMGRLMSLAPKDMQGRIFAITGLFTGGLGALAPIAVGGMLGWVGFPTTLVVLSGLLLVSCLGALLSRPMRSIGRPSDWD